LGESKGANERRVNHSLDKRGGGKMGVFSHARKRRKEVDLIRAQWGTNREITEHKEVRIKGRSER
jgi:hypothetical protein